MQIKQVGYFQFWRVNQTGHRRIHRQAAAIIGNKTIESVATLLLESSVNPTPFAVHLELHDGVIEQ